MDRALLFLCYSRYSRYSCVIRYTRYTRGQRAALPRGVHLARDRARVRQLVHNDFSGLGSRYMTVT